MYFKTPEGKNDSDFIDATAKAIIREHLDWTGSAVTRPSERARYSISEAEDAYVNARMDEYEDFSELYGEGCDEFGFREMLLGDFEENVAVKAMAIANERWVATMATLGIEG